MRHLPLVLLFAFSLAACRGVTVNRLGDIELPPHERRVCIIEGPSPEGVLGTRIADVRVELNTYGGDRRAKASLARQARKLGADAVVDAVFSNTMGAPEGEGTAVVFASPKREPPKACQWY